MEWVYTFILLSSCLVFADSNENYHVHETQAGLELITPYGKKIIMGDYAPDGGFNYNIEIPMSEIKPSPTPTPQPQLPTVMMMPGMPGMQMPGGANSTSNTTENNTTITTKKVEEEKREPAAVIPPKIIIEYDETDRMVLEANRLYNKKKFYESTQVVEEILRKKPDYARAWVMKGSLMYAQKQSDLAKKAWQQALVLEPNNLQVKNLLEKFK